MNLYEIFMAAVMQGTMPFIIVGGDGDVYWGEVTPYNEQGIRNVYNMSRRHRACFTVLSAVKLHDLLHIDA